MPNKPACTLVGPKWKLIIFFSSSLSELPFTNKNYIIQLNNTVAFGIKNIKKKIYKFMNNKKYAHTGGKIFMNDSIVGVIFISSCNTKMWAQIC